MHRPNIKLSFTKAFKERGDWWRKLVLDIPEPYGYFETHDYKDDDSIFKGLVYEQEQMSKIFDVLSCDKLKIDTSDECWESYIHEIIEKVGYEYQPEENKLPEIIKYCGTYQIEGGEDTWSICYDDEKKRIYTSLFWPCMPMKYIGNEQIELISFPVTLQFDIISDKVLFKVNGNYDWEYNNKRFVRI